MSLISFKFILFCILLLLCYYLLPKKFQWVVLLIFSLGFYAFAGIRNSIYIIITSLSAWIGALWLEKIGQKAKEYMDKGLLVPDELVVDLVVDRLAQDDAKKGYVLDGFPRTIPQAEALDKALAELGQKMDYAIDVDVPDENIIHRMGGRRACVGCGATYHLEYAPTKVEGICDVCGKELILRDDDKPETVKQRLEVYHTQTQPLIDYYTKEGILKEVDGTQDLQKVFDDITAILG